MLTRPLFRDAKISTKFNLLLIFVFVVGMALSGGALATVLQQRAQFEVTAQATLLMQTMNSVRAYTQTHVNPLLLEELETEPGFVSESVPTYSAREVFENLRQNEIYTDFFYKDATLNPTNLRDKADDFETELINRFRREPETKELSGFHTLPEGKVFYIARPFAITDPNCLQCHSTPGTAPKSQITTYGPDNGFNWKLNDVITAQVVSVPAEAVFDNARRSLALVMGILFGIFTIVILLINFLLKKAVIQRIKSIARAAHATSTGEMRADFKDNSKDEIGALAAAFNRMKSSLTIAMEMLNQRKP